MVRKPHGTTSNTAAADNAFARRALEAIAEIEQEATRKKSEQLENLREALKNIDGRISELTHQREQVQQAIGRITGKPVESAPAAGRRPRMNHDELRNRVVRWLSSHAGEQYASADLQREFPELEAFPSIAMFLKQPIADGIILVDKSGGNRNTKYTATQK